MVIVVNVLHTAAIISGKVKFNERKLFTDQKRTQGLNKNSGKRKLAREKQVLVEKISS
jgi:hypothetical protein